MKRARSLLLVLVAPSFAQATIRVPADAATIQEGIALAQTGDTVLVAPGTYHEALDFLGKAITVRSEAGAASTIVDATGTGSPAVGFFSGEGPSSILQGFTLTGGSSSSWPGTGISCFGASGIAAPLIRDCVVTGNRSSAASGAGVAGNATLEDCLIEGNRTGDGAGGGVFGAPTLRRCTVRANSAYDSGGLYLLGGLLEDCRILENYGGEGAIAGGVTIAGNGVVLRRCVVARNTSSGFYQYSVKGAGVHIGPGLSATLENCTVVDNHVVDPGPYPADDVGGIYGNALLVNTILRGNDAGEYAPGSGLAASYSDIEGAPAGTGNFDLDPLFVDQAAGDYHLRAGSPCIDAGDPASPPEFDCTCADVGAFALPRAKVLARIGTGINRPCFTILSQPVVGTTFVLRVDASLHPGARLSGFLGVDAPLSPGVVYPFGELLIDAFGGRKLVQASRPSTGYLDDFPLPIPADPALIGLIGYLQGWILGGGVELCNGLDVLLGR